MNIKLFTTDMLFYKNLYITLTELKLLYNDLCMNYIELKVSGCFPLQTTTSTASSTSTTCLSLLPFACFQFNITFPDAFAVLPALVVAAKLSTACESAYSSSSSSANACISTVGATSLKVNSCRIAPLPLLGPLKMELPNTTTALTGA